MNIRKLRTSSADCKHPGVSVNKTRGNNKNRFIVVIALLLNLIIKIRIKIAKRWDCTGAGD